MMSSAHRPLRKIRKAVGAAVVAAGTLSCGPLPPVSGSNSNRGGSNAPLGSATLPAFPGAEGFGAAATGGRGGRVLKVTTLKSRGPGSLRAALNAKGPRIIVFDVSGVIDAGLLEIPHGNLTIAGQTAPGGGITIRGRLYAAYESGVDNIIMRHVRIRPAAYKGRDGEQFDALQLSLSRLIMLDHMSIAFGVDENVDLYEADQVTVQWSTIEESAVEGHPEGKHNFGLIQGEDGWEISLHHNLFVHHKSRTPAIANGPSEVRNNISYNCRQGFVHNNDAAGHISIVGNTYRRGPSDEMFPFYFDWDQPGHNLQYYLADNFVDDPKNFTGLVDDPWAKPFVHPAFEYLELAEDGSSREFRSATPFDIASETDSPYFPVTTQPSQEAYESVLQGAGAFPRDVITTRDVQETRDRSGLWGARIPRDLMAGLSPTAALPDGDGDGMPDTWERAQGLDSSNASDHKTVMPNGYTAIENYINESADALVP
jgi:pectate lyase